MSLIEDPGSSFTVSYRMMAVSRRKVAVCGSGLGRYIAESIITRCAGRWDLVFVSRHAQPHLTARGITVRVVNYASISSLTRALVGVHTVISCIPDDQAQLLLIEACLKVGVVRFAPSEFEGPPARRPIFSNGGRDKLTVLRRLDEVRSYIQSTVFVCGLLYETFTPNGWISCGGGGWDTGCFLLDMKKKTATVPEDPQLGGANSTVCFTSAEDVGRFVSSALDLDYWPSELRMWGERLKMKDLIRMAEHIRDRRFRVRLLSEEELMMRMGDAIDTNDYSMQLYTQAMQSIQLHELCFGICSSQYDYEPQFNLNHIFPELRTLSLESFLRRHYRASTH